MGLHRSICVTTPDCVSPDCPDPDMAKRQPADILQAGSSLYESFGYRFPCSGLVGTGDTLKHTNFFDENTTAGQYVPMASDIRIFNPDDPYHAVINTADQDYIFAYGMQMRYYKIKPIAEQSTYDPLYGEAPSREYENGAMVRAGKFAELAEVNPLVMWGLSSHEELNQQLTNFAMDSTKVTTFYLNITYARRLLGRDPMIGDVVVIWDIPEIPMEVSKVVAASKTLYIPRRWKLYCNAVQWSK